MYYFGVDYYPEHWPEERWAVDARLMAEADMNIVRLAEFAWSKMEPKDGVFDFDWLDRAIDILAKHGISGHSWHSYRFTTSLAGARTSGNVPGSGGWQADDIMETAGNIAQTIPNTRNTASGL